MDNTVNAINALKELLAAGTAYREAEQAVRIASATKARKAVLSRNEALDKLHRAEAIARDVLDDHSTKPGNRASKLINFC